MSLTRAGRPRNDMLRSVAQQAAAHPRIEAAVLGAIRAELPGVIEGLLRQMHGGDTLRLYIPKGNGNTARDARDMRIGAALAAGEAPGLVAERERISLRRVQQIQARTKKTAKSSA